LGSRARKKRVDLGQEVSKAVASLFVSGFKHGSVFACLVLNERIKPGFGLFEPRFQMACFDCDL
jgi:hypothetical protein